MKKLNNKGYMLIEIILASVITFTIAFSLINLILKFKNTNEDLYNETNILNDRISITKNIMDDIKDYTLVEINKETSGNITTVNLKLEDSNQEEIIKRLIIDNSSKTIEYGTYKDNVIKKNNKSYYKKTLSKTNEIGDIATIENNDTITIKIPISSIYSKKSYDIMLLLKEKNKPTLSTLQSVPGDSDTEKKIWDNTYKETIIKIVIEQGTVPIDNAIQTFDLSTDGKIKGYVTEDNIIYIKSKGKIKLNPNSANLFNGFIKVESIEGLELLDTSEVTNMNSMFKETSIKELNLCTFNTEKVTDMDRMFEETSNLEQILVGNKWQLKGTTTNIFTNSKINSFVTNQCN